LSFLLDVSRTDRSRFAGGFKKPWKPTPENLIAYVSETPDAIHHDLKAASGGLRQGGK
jgi:hypothetical protein